MTPHEKSLVRDSFAKVVPIGDTAASLFYGRLFELNPNLRPLFTTDLQEQGLMSFLLPHKCDTTVPIGSKWSDLAAQSRLQR